MQDASNAVCRLPAKRRAALLVAIECAPLEQLGDVARAVLDEHVDGGRDAQPVAGGERVPGVQLRRVIGPDGGSNAALRVPGVALAGVSLCEDHDRTQVGQRYRGT